MAMRQHNPVDDAHLTEALANVMGHLRLRQYGVVLGRFENALRGSADAFVNTLAQHLRHEEEVLFPGLRMLNSETADEVEALQREHARLRKLTIDLARFIKAGDTGTAYDVARIFLAELYNHIEREGRVVDRVPRFSCPAPLDPSDTDYAD